jgi:hypothetical protein
VTTDRLGALKACNKGEQPEIVEAQPSMTSAATGSAGSEPQPEFVAVTREAKLWARGILETMDAAVADAAALDDGLMVFLGSVAFGALGSRIPVARWQCYLAVIGALGNPNVTLVPSVSACRAGISQA